MDAESMKHEQLSALADGELQGEEFAQAMEFAAQDEGQSTWRLYHLVGDVLRSPELAGHSQSDPSMVQRIREQLAQEAGPGRFSDAGLRVAQITQPDQAEAANTAVLRWKMAAGFATLVAVAAIGWSSFGSLTSGGGAQMAAAPAAATPAAPAASAVAVAGNDGQPVMIRDPRLDELLAAHKQLGNASALQLPAGFLRNATFDTPGR